MPRDRSRLATEVAQASTTGRRPIVRSDVRRPSIDPFRRAMSRRGFIALAGSSASVLLLAACSGPAATQQPAPAAPAPAAPAPAAPGAPAPAAKAGPGGFSGGGPLKAQLNAHF